MCRYWPKELFHGVRADIEAKEVVNAPGLRVGFRNLGRIHEYVPGIAG